MRALARLEIEDWKLEVEVPSPLEERAEGEG
jgi:hypothetical protein